MGGRRPEGHITDPGNTRVEETNRKQGRMGACFEGGEGQMGVMGSNMEGNLINAKILGRKKLQNVFIFSATFD